MRRRLPAGMIPGMVGRIMSAPVERGNATGTKKKKRKASNEDKTRRRKERARKRKRGKR